MRGTLSPPWYAGAVDWCVPRPAAVAFLFTLFASIAFSMSTPAWAEGNADCLECHDDVVDAHKYEASAHAELECVFCHQWVELDDEFEHGDDVEPVDCAECHEDEAAEHAKSIHGVALAGGDEMAPHCWDCHGTHFIRSHLDPTSPTSTLNIPMTCGTCHREGSPVTRTHDIPQGNILENYSQFMHGPGLFEKGLTVTAVCTSCHTSHDIRPHTDPASSIHPDNVVETCRQCHGRIEAVHRRKIEGRLWEDEPGRIPICVDCHAPHKAPKRRDTQSAQTDVCMDCHASDAFRDRTMIRDGVEVSLYVVEADYNGSIHTLKNIQCAQCHTQVTRLHPDRGCATITAPVNCAACHAEPVELYAASAHGMKAAEGDPDAPTCLDCHGTHDTQSRNFPLSMTFPRNVPDLCARCHREGETVAQRVDADVPIIDSYLMSIHGKGLRESGLLVTATCVNCHSAHGPLPNSDPRSTVHDDNVADTCGTCHHGIEEQFKLSVHWPGNTETDRPLPNCKDCHTSHTIGRAEGGNFRQLMMTQCGRCHEDEAETFFETFHGKVSRLGSDRSAKCHDCHGAHGILPPSDPESTLSRDNVVATCGQCHEGSHRRFAGYLTHATHHDQEKYPWLFWTFWGMTALLIGTLVISLLHTGAWLTRLWLTRDEWRAAKALAKPAPGEKVYRRFDRYQRLQHMLMIISFFTLAITGMALKFSYMGWAQALSTVVHFDAMSTLHRTAAVLLFIDFGVHIAYARRRRKREGVTWKQWLTGPRSILFTKRDLKEAAQSIKWFFGRGERPRYGRYTYWEKFDYMAVFWGIAVIGTTGLMLWFPTVFTHVVPGWFINVATIIHSDEALLAVGFIFTIHFFNTHFRPDKFPMDPIIFTGRVTLAELKHDKPREYERLVASGELEKHMVDPFPAGVTRGFKIFGFTALAIGLLLIGFIVYSMIWAYA